MYIVGMIDPTCRSENKNHIAEMEAMIMSGWIGEKAYHQHDNDNDKEDEDEDEDDSLTELSYQESVLKSS